MAEKPLKPEFRDSQNRKITINSRVFYYTCSSFSYFIKNFRADMLKKQVYSKHKQEISETDGCCPKRTLEIKDIYVKQHKLISPKIMVTRVTVHV